MATKNAPARTEEKVAPVTKFTSVIVLPCQRGLPIGHILLTAIHGDSLAGTRTFDCKTEQELNEKLRELMRSSGENGYQVELLVAARVHYQTTLRQFSRDPLAAVEYCRSYAPQQRQQSAVTEDDLPF